MTTRKKRIITVVTVLLVGLVGVGSYVYYMHYIQRHIGEQIGKAVAEQITGPHPVRNVDTQAWASLQVGMTQQRVIEILGDAPSKHKSEPSQMGTTQDSDQLEFWEYNYSYGLFAPVPHPKAYVIYFDQDQKVTSFRGPADETGAAKMDSK
jgi:hypothetical protein